MDDMVRGIAKGMLIFAMASGLVVMAIGCEHKQGENAIEDPVGGLLSAADHVSA